MNKTKVSTNLKQKLKVYYLTTIFSVFFAVIGFSYNAWRLEVTEDNNNIRTAAFELLVHLAEFEQVVFYAHYDQDKQEGNPRKGWIKVGLIADLSSLVSVDSHHSAQKLKTTCQDNWQYMTTEQQSVDLIVDDVEAVRKQVKQALSRLE